MKIRDLKTGQKFYFTNHREMGIYTVVRQSNESTTYVVDEEMHRLDFNWVHHSEITVFAEVTNEVKEKVRLNLNTLELVAKIANEITEYPEKLRQSEKIYRNFNNTLDRICRDYGVTFEDIVESFKDDE